MPPAVRRAALRPRAVSRLLPLLLSPAALLCACSPGAPAIADPTTPAATPALTPSATPTPTPPPTPVPTPIPLSVAVRPFHEPDDYAHRNYCGAGATEVLLSAWLPASATPDVEAVARSIRLDPRIGATGADTAAGINDLLRPVVQPALGADRYRGEHVTSLDVVLAHLRADLGDRRALDAFGHTVPVMVQTMTRTMPGWGGWQATHMITIASANLDSGDPSVDTVTYAETPGPVAGYNGPPFQTISVSALWTAMQAFLTDYPVDPINVIW